MKQLFYQKKNISKYGLNNFNIKTEFANDNLKFKNINGYIKRKFLKKTDLFRKKKFFYVEPKNNNKITYFNDTFLTHTFSNNLFLEGHFESEKYFIDHKKEIIEQFNFSDSDYYIKNPYFLDIANNNAVGICLRQNRFLEGRGKNKYENILKSKKYINEQIAYINKSVKIIKSKITNPIFFIWSNDIKDINYKMFNFDVIPVDLSTDNKNDDIRGLSLFLLSKCRHFITIPSTFNWWGAWLSKDDNKIIMRPSANWFSEFSVNNKDFWPKNWLNINIDN